MILNWSGGPYLNTASYAGAIVWNEGAAGGILGPVQIVELIFTICRNVALTFGIVRERQETLSIVQAIVMNLPIRKEHPEISGIRRELNFTTER